MQLCGVSLPKRDFRGKESEWMKYGWYCAWPSSECCFQRHINQRKYQHKKLSLTSVVFPTYTLMSIVYCALLMVRHKLTDVVCGNVVRWTWTTVEIRSGDPMRPKKNDWEQNKLFVQWATEDWLKLQRCVFISQQINWSKFVIDYDKVPEIRSSFAVKVCKHLGWDENIIIYEMYWMRNSMHLAIGVMVSGTDHLLRSGRSRCWLLIVRLR